jgi:S1-C subfamily serine protease
VVGTPNDVVDYSVADRVAVAAEPSIVTVRTVGPDGPSPVGSGVAVRSDRVITNAHLVAGASALEVVTEDGTVVPAKVVGTDPQTDLTLLSVTDADLPTLGGPASDTTGVGTTVVAVAATRGGRYRVDIDVVSDQNQVVDAGTGALVAGLLETGMQAAPAWSGGALLDADGNLVGVLTAPANPASGGGLLAVPASMVHDVEDQLDTSGAVHHGWLGVLFAKDAVNLPAGGARLGFVVPGSPAASAGLAAGDVVTHAGDSAVGGMADLMAAARSLRPQDPLDVGYLGTDGKAHHTRVTLGAGDPQQLALYPGMG